MDELSHRVRTDVIKGKELHSDEQAPAFLYSDVLNLEKFWEEIEESAKEQHQGVLVSARILVVNVFVWVCCLFKTSFEEYGLWKACSNVSFW